MALSPQQIAQYAYRAGFRGADLVKAVAVALAESGGNPQAYNPETAAGTKPGSGSRGLWQIYGTAHPQYNNASVFDPQANANAAYQVYREAGNRFTPWSTWNLGMASRIIPTLPKFKIDGSPVAVAQATTKAVAQMAGQASEAASNVTSLGGAVGSQIQSGVDGALESVKNAIAGKTPEGKQREIFDAGIYSIGFVLVLIGLVFLFLQSDTGKNTVALVGEGTKIAATGGLSKVL